MFHSINFVRYLIDASEEEIVLLLSACKICDVQCDESISLRQPAESYTIKENKRNVLGGEERESAIGLTFRIKVIVEINNLQLIVVTLCNVILYL